LWEIEQGLGLTAQAVHEASVIRSAGINMRRGCSDRYDAVVLPTAQVWPFPADWRWPQEIAGRKMDTYHRWMEVVVPASLIGLPALSVPVGVRAAGPAIRHADHRAVGR
jgi:amidase